MSDNPFAEPDDDNRTIIRPNPGRRRPAQPQPQPQAQPSEPAGREHSEPTQQERPSARPAPLAEGTENIAIGEDALIAAAQPLLQLMARLRNTANPPDSGDLRERTVRQIRLFEKET